MRAFVGVVAVVLCMRGFAAHSEYDIVIYGSSPAAISAAVQAKRMGKSAVIVSPETRIGGLTTGGLGQTDIGNKRCFGGIALEFYEDVARYYDDEANWRWQKRTDFKHVEQGVEVTKGSMWVFEPSAALKILEGWEKRDGLVIHRGKRLDRSEGQVKVEGLGLQRKIKSFKTEDGTEYCGRMFVDATYEGDLMAAAGVSYTVGREANSAYGETLSGTQVGHSVYHQFKKGVDPYVVKGNKSSGLLPNVEPGPAEEDGTGDRRVQAYCFRMCLTDHPENRIPFEKPAGYDERDYELLFRNFEAGETGMPWINSRMPNRKTDTNNRTGFSTDFIGRNWNWPEASYAERDAIRAEHLKYQQGLMWTLANHPRVPEKVRREVARWGLCKDEFADGLGGGWQTQLYVREARRMIGECVMTERHCRGTKKSARPVAMGAYGMDSHNVRRYVGQDGFVHNEGDVEVGAFPYGIDYGVIVPKRGECGNLFVPVCLSASHIAFGSIRMEPVFFALGQAAATAAAQAIDAGCAVQDLPFGPLAARLVRDGQVLSLGNRECLVPRPREIAYLGGSFHEADTAKRVYATDASLPKEGYALTIAADGIRIASADADGRYWAERTLDQLRRDDGSYPCCVIKDWPEFHYRGIFLDEGRHYYGVAAVKRLIDEMVRVKLNVFHWHLVEHGNWDQTCDGWRVQVPGYPKLTENVRKSYSRAELEEVVAYAAKHHVRVVPEIEMPGHNDVTHYYPEFGHGGKGGGICVANEKAVRFFTDTIDYATSVFPDAFFHFGGDEVAYANWKSCPDCQAKMKALGLKTEAELQAWFMNEMALHLKTKGKTALGWNDMLTQLTNRMRKNEKGYYTGYSIQKNLSKDVVLTAWYGDWECAGGSGAICANLGYKTLHYPFNHCYFDYPQGIPGDTNPYCDYGGVYFTLRDAYMWDPYADVKPECRKNILGICGCNWSEKFSTDLKALEWRCWPRGFATAEIAWTCPKLDLTAKDSRQFAEFKARAQELARRFRRNGIAVAHQEGSSPSDHLEK